MSEVLFRVISKLTSLVIIKSLFVYEQSNSLDVSSFSNKALSIPQRAFLRSVKSLFPNHISGSSLNVVSLTYYNPPFSIVTLNCTPKVRHKTFGVQFR